MKTLANCKPSEFLKQTNRIRKAVRHWLDVTKIMEIRKNVPKFDENATEDEKTAILQERSVKNANAILTAIMEDHPDETLELLALLCFVEPENVDDYLVEDYLSAFNELVGSKPVLDFFTSLAQLDQIVT